MCGIIGVASLRYNVASIIKSGLEKLEYRGYDSVGIASIASNTILIKKGKGKIHEVETRYGLSRVPGSIAVGHTRWATHGAPSDVNAHPHADCTGRVAVVHNGIIENYLELKEKLTNLGHVFKSETDTEVLAHLIEEFLKELKPFEAFRKAISMIRGSYAFAVLISNEPEKIFFARKDSPLVIGVGEGMNFIASDIPAFLEHTRRVIVVHDGELGYITPVEIYLENSKGERINYLERIIVVDWTPDMARKEGYPHFMIKEIHEQPRAIRDTIRGIDENYEKAVELMLDSEKIFVTAAGTSYHASLVFSLIMSKLAGKLVIPFISSEYLSYANSADENSLLIAVSQSGETIDTLMALREFKKRGARIIALSNIIGSAIPRESTLAIYTRAGPEIGVAATKTFTTQVTALTWLAINFSEKRGAINQIEAKSLYKVLRDIPEKTERIISMYEAWARSLGRDFANKNNAYYLGRGISLPIAMEGALKMKEIAYIHAEAYPAGESKHGPIALIEENFPVIFVSIEDRLERRLLGNIEEMKARGAYTIGVVPENSILISKLDNYVAMPRISEIFLPILSIIPLQLLAYYTAVSRGYDPDKPRNLAKTVTVE